MSWQFNTKPILNLNNRSNGTNSLFMIIWRTVTIISRDPLSVEPFVRFTTVPLNPLSVEPFVRFTTVPLNPLSVEPFVRLTTVPLNPLSVELLVRFTTVPLNPLFVELFVRFTTVPLIPQSEWDIVVLLSGNKPIPLISFLSKRNVV